jgi:hypothetical protein
MLQPVVLSSQFLTGPQGLNLLPRWLLAQRLEVGDGLLQLLLLLEQGLQLVSVGQQTLYLPLQLEGLHVRGSEDWLAGRKWSMAG